jgi:hypothetical protein
LFVLLAVIFFLFFFSRFLVCWPYSQTSSEGISPRPDSPHSNGTSPSRPLSSNLTDSMGEGKGPETHVWCAV